MAPPTPSSSPPACSVSASSSAAPRPPPPSPPPGPGERTAPPRPLGGVAKINDHAEALAGELRQRPVERRRADAAAGRRDATELADAVAELVAEEAAVLSPARRDLVAELIMRETVGLGPLEELLGDPEVEEVMVNGHERVY